MTKALDEVDLKLAKMREPSWGRYGDNGMAELDDKSRALVAKMEELLRLD